MQCYSSVFAGRKFSASAKVSKTWEIKGDINIINCKIP